MAMNSTALTSGDPDTADRVVDRRARGRHFTGTELISAVVSGATSRLIPTPKTSVPSTSRR